MELLDKKPRNRTILAVEVVVLLVALGVLALYGGRAWRIYQQVLTSERLFAKGEAAADKNDTRAAVAAWEECIAVNPRYFPALDGLATIYDQDLHQRDRAVRLLEAHLTAAGDDPRIHKDLGFYYIKTGAFQKAIEQLRIAVAALPRDPMCRNMLAQAEEGATGGRPARVKAKAGAAQGGPVGAPGVPAKMVVPPTAPNQER